VTETTRFEWVVGSLSKYTLGDKVTSSSVSAGHMYTHTHTHTRTHTHTIACVL
jgi:hypothetical protein